MVEIEVKNADIISEALQKAAKQLGDLTIPLTSITQDFYQSQKAIFSLSGPGQYDDLSGPYKKEKEKAVGFVYPILRRSGRLMKSVTDPKDPETINYIVNKNTLFIGTRVPYGVLHQEGIGVPRRPFLFIGPESSYATSEQSGRVQRWLQIIEDYTQKVMRLEGV